MMSLENGDVDREGRCPGRFGRDRGRPAKDLLKCLVDRASITLLILVAASAYWGIPGRVLLGGPSTRWNGSPQGIPGTFAGSGSVELSSLQINSTCPGLDL